MNFRPPPIMGRILCLWATVLVLHGCVDTHGKPGLASVKPPPPSRSNGIVHHSLEGVRGFYYFTDIGRYRWHDGAYEFSEELLQKPQVQYRGFLLTFDDVEFDSSIDRILELLAKAQQRAVFFITGTRLDGVRDQRIAQVLTAMIDGGHELGIHTQGHPNFEAAYFDPSIVGFDRAIARVKEQFIRLEERINNVLGRSYPFRWWRPPFGIRGNGQNGSGALLSHPGLVDTAALEVGRSIMLWHINSLDYLLQPWDRGRAHNDGLLVQFAQRTTAFDGGIVLFHSNHNTARYLEQYLAKMNPLAHSSPDQLWVQKYTVPWQDMAEPWNPLSQNTLLHIVK